MSTVNPALEKAMKAAAEKTELDAFRYRIRKNSVLTWIDQLEEVIQLRSILEQCNLFSTLHIESGVVRVDPTGRYLSHKYVPYIKAGFNFLELSVLLRAEVISFEDTYGRVPLEKKDLDSLKKIMYKYNQEFGRLDISDKKKLIHLEQTGEVLSRLLTTSIVLVPQINGWCSLIFTRSDNSVKDFCTIFSEDEILLLEKVNKAVQGRN